MKVEFVGGKGEFINGVPARDLSTAEWEGLTAEQRQACLSTRLYKIEAGKPAKGKTEIASSEASSQ
jgi:hypothetical protein